MMTHEELSRNISTGQRLIYEASEKLLTALDIFTDVNETIKDPKWSEKFNEHVRLKLIRSITNIAQVSEYATPFAFEAWYIDSQSNLTNLTLEEPSEQDIQDEQNKESE